MHKIITYLFLLLFGQQLLACQCEVLPSHTIDNLKKYDVIFTGRVLAVSENGVESKAHFIVNSVFQGGLYKEVDVQYDAESDCAMSFAPGETWTIYGSWAKYGLPLTGICTHSRKKPAAGEQDIYLGQGRASWDAEQKYLTDSLGVKKFLDPADFKDMGHKNIIPDGTQALVYLGLGLGGLGVIFLVVKRIFRKDGK